MLFYPVASAEINQQHNSDSALAAIGTEATDLGIRGGVRVRCVCMQTIETYPELEVFMLHAKGFVPWWLKYLLLLMPSTNLTSLLYPCMQPGHWVFSIKVWGITHQFGSLCVHTPRKANVLIHVGTCTHSIVWNSMFYALPIFFIIFLFKLYYRCVFCLNFLRELKFGYPNCSRFI